MTKDALLSATDKEGLLCELYVNAVATISGYTVAKGNLDKDGVDVTISAGGEYRPKLDIQCKATFNLKWTGSSASFPLPIRNYDLLRCAVQTPRLLVVLDLPKSEADWLTIRADELILRKCAYWLSLSGAAEITNSTSKTVSLPAKNRFDPASLSVLMEQSRTGTIS
jgi:Domain of unknown function (DUF4365)